MWITHEVKPQKVYRAVKERVTSVRDRSLMSSRCYGGMGFKETWRSIRIWVLPIGIENTFQTYNQNHENRTIFNRFTFLAKIFWALRSLSLRPLTHDPVTRSHWFFLLDWYCSHLSSAVLFSRRTVERMFFHRYVRVTVVANVIPILMVIRAVLKNREKPFGKLPW